MKPIKKFSAEAERRVVYAMRNFEAAESANGTPETAEKKVDLSAAVEKLLEVKVKQKEIREYISMYLERQQEDPEKWLMWLREGMHKLLYLYDEIKQLGEAAVRKKGDNAFENESAVESGLIQEMNSRFDSYAGVAEFARGLGLASADTELYCAKQHFRNLDDRLSEFEKGRFPKDEEWEKLDANGLSDLIARLKSIGDLCDQIEQEAKPSDASGNKDLIRYLSKVKVRTSKWKEYATNGLAFAGRIRGKLNHQEAVRNIRNGFNGKAADLQARHRNRKNLKSVDEVKALSKDLADLGKYLAEIKLKLESASVFAVANGYESIEKDCKDLLTHVSEWEKFLIESAPDLKYLEFQAALQELRVEKEGETADTLRIKRAKLAREMYGTAEGEVRYEKRNSRADAVITGAGGKRIKSFAREALSNDEYVKKFEEIITTPALYYMYEETFLDPYQQPVDGAPAGDVLAQIRLWGKEICSVAKRERELEKKYRIEIDTEDLTSPWVEASNYSIASLSHKMAGLAEVLELFPTKLIENSEITTIRLLSDIKRIDSDGRRYSIAGQACDGNDGKGVMVDDGLNFPHELAHMLFRSKTSSIKFVPSGDVLRGIRNPATRTDVRYVGYASGYGKYGGPEEDMAEVLHWLIMNPVYLDNKVLIDKKYHGNTELEKKIAKAKEFYLEMSDGKMNKAFWSAREAKVRQEEAVRETRELVRTRYNTGSNPRSRSRSIRPGNSELKRRPSFG